MSGRIKIRTLPLHYNIKKDIPSIPGWAFQKVSLYLQLSYLTDCQVQCNIAVCLIIYQNSSKICPFFSDNTCDSCKRCPRTVRQHMNHTFGRKLLGRGGSVNWPTQSSELNPLDFWLRGFLKALLCSGYLQDLEVWQTRVENVYQEIRAKPGIFERVRNSVRQRAVSWQTEKPHRPCVVEITIIWPTYQQAMALQHMSQRLFNSVSTTHPNSVTSIFAFSAGDATHHPVVYCINHVN